MSAPGDTPQPAHGTPQPVEDKDEGGEPIDQPGAGGEDLGPPAVVVPDVNESDSSVAAAQLLPTGSDTGDDVSIYQLKWVEWGDGFAPIVVQNENGPCPLLALCNVLILTGRIKITPGHTDVSSTHLTDLLGTYLLELHKNNQLSDGEKANLEQNIQDTMAIFPKLQTGLDVNVKFDSVSGFEFTQESGVFDLVGVPLYHGWLVDPQNPSYQVVKELSYNQLVEMVINNTSSEDSKLVEEALLGQQFLESTASQLTYHGIFELNRRLKEGELSVFFRNNHFNTLMKKKGHLLTLVTDHGFLNEMGYVWQTVLDVDGGGDFLDAQFHLSPHSQTQQKREEAVPSSSATPSTQTTTTSEVRDTGGEPRKEGETPINQDLDYQTALSLQEEEYHTQQQQQHRHVDQAAISSPPQAAATAPGTLHQELLDHELAARLQEEVESAPPNTAAEYERVALEEHRQSRSSNCTLQ